MICVTGHRPEKLGGYSDGARARLERFAVYVLEVRRPEGIVTGMAQGWDQAIAAAAAQLGIPFLAFIPFPAHAHAARWPAEARALYESLLGKAEMVFPCSDEIPVSHHRAARLLQQRNERMVDRVESVEALWDGTVGGTFNCIEYARRRGVPIVNHWSTWAASEVFWALLT